MINAILEENEQIAGEMLASINMLGEQREQETDENNAELERMRESGKYNPEYLGGITFEDKKPYKESYERIVELRAPQIAHNISVIRGLLDDYFNAELSMDLSNKIISFTQMDVELSAKEFDALSKSAISYADKRLLNQYAEKHGYSAVKVPDIDGIYRELDNYEASLLNCLAYGGKNGALMEYIDKWTTPSAENGHVVHNKGLAKTFCAMADAFIRENETGRFRAYLDSTGLELDIKELSKEELDLIEELVESEKYPYSVESRVKELAQKNSFTRDLLLRHPEYRKHII